MTDRETLYTGAGRAAWGYFFLYLDINLGSLNILPDWGAYLLFLSAIRLLAGERRDLGLLRPLGILLAAWHGADWALALFGGGVSGLWAPADVVIGVVQMYFHFQLLTDCAALAAAHQGPEEAVDRFQQQGSQPQPLLPPHPQPQLLLLPQPQPFPPPQQQHTRMRIRMIQQQLPLLPNMNDTPRFQSLEGPPA